MTSAVLVFSGCRQPVVNSGGNQPSLFGSVPKLFGNSGTQANRPSLFGSTAGSNGYASNGYTGPQNQQQLAALTGNVQNLNQRLSAYDSDNQLLNTEVAGLKQKLQLANQFNQTLKEQLADTSGRVQQTELQRQTALQQLAAAQLQVKQATQNGGNGQGQLVGFGGNSAPSQFAGGATIRANNSLLEGFSRIRIPGGQARMDGDVIRIEFPTDQMFVPGSYQIQAAQLSVMQNIVSTIRQGFPKQIVGIEAHWDNTPLNPPTTTHHQLTATQALAVFDNLVRLGLPKNQMFTMAMASNRPRHPQGTAGNPNRRIELVIYPETYDGSR
ncbi:MAG: flagellar motor protein MotB [Mariniblastus sp.]|jgi:flagellar motor protein MotB